MAAASDMPPVVFNAAINDTNEMKDSLISFTDLWLLDGGCTDHMISDKTDFSTYTKFTRPLPIGGIKCETIGIGSVCMHIQTCDNESIPAVVENVLHVPDLPTRSQEGFRRLLSQSTACKGGSEFIFSSKGNYIYFGEWLQNTSFINPEEHIIWIANLYQERFCFTSSGIPRSVQGFQKAMASTAGTFA